MNIRCRKSYRWGPRVGIVAIGLLTACPIIGNHTGTDSQTAFRSDQVAKIERNRTTKREVIESLGFPRSIARNGQPADDFKMFAATQPITDDSTVYYYRNVSRRNSETWGGVMILPVPGGGFGGTMSRSNSQEDAELWILFDERSGLVLDYVRRSDAR